MQNVTDAVASVALAREQDWEYAPPESEGPPTAVALSLDGTSMLLAGGRPIREVVVGSISRYDAAGERRHTIYADASPEYGEQRFFDRMDREIDRVKAAYPGATDVGLPDGAAAVGRLLVSPVETRGRGGRGPDRLEARGAALGRKRLPAEVEAASTYFRNQVKGGRMAYAELVAARIPIGSGVTEAACKVLVKQRLCGSGMRWEERAPAAVLSLRCLTYTPERPEQFWSRADRSGFPVAA